MLDKMMTAFQLGLCILGGKWDVMAAELGKGSRIQFVKMRCCGSITFRIGTPNVGKMSLFLFISVQPFLIVCLPSRYESLKRMLSVDFGVLYFSFSLHIFHRQAVLCKTLQCGWRKMEGRGEKERKGSVKAWGRGRRRGNLEQDKGAAI